MKKIIKIEAYLLLMLLPTLMVNAATLAVLPGESIQAKIDAATDGDIVAVFGGVYSEDLTIDKAIRLVEVSGEEVTIQGQITFTGITDAPPFEGFTVGSGGKHIIVTDTTGLLIRAIDHTAGDQLIINGTSDSTRIADSALNNFDPDAGVVELVGSSVAGRLEQNGGSLHTTNVTVGGNFDTGLSSARTIAFRTTVAGDCNWRGNRSWFGYSKARSFNFVDASNAKVVVVGSEIDRVNEQEDGIRLEGSSNKFFVSNTIIKGVRAYLFDDNCIQVVGSGNSAIISNNYLANQYYSGSYSGDDHILRVSGTTDVLFINNICSTVRDGIAYAPFGVTVLNNHSVNGRTGTVGGVVASNTTSGDPGFVDGDPYQLGAGSPCIDTGTEDPRYNDRDGSRNDIGPSGGAWYDPDGWTTENPVVISFDLSHDQILEGDTSPVLLQEGLGVSVP